MKGGADYALEASHPLDVGTVSDVSNTNAPSIFSYYVEYDWSFASSSVASDIAFYKYCALSRI
jgi:hypothetical protein